MPSDSRLYPQGTGAPKSRFVSGTLVDFGVAKSQRTRVTLAQMNAGFTLLPARVGVKWRVLDAVVIAIGGNATAGTSVNIIGTVAGSAVQILVAAIAALTRSALVRIGAANAVILADGASFTAMDANTAVTCITVGTAMTTSTAFDVLLTYVADQA